MLSNGPGVERAVKESGIRRNVKNRDGDSNRPVESDTSITPFQNTASSSTDDYLNPNVNNADGIKRSGSDIKQGVGAEKKVPSSEKLFFRALEKIFEH